MSQVATGLYEEKKMNSVHYDYWKANAMVLAIQLVIGALLLVKTGNPLLSAIFVGAGTLLISSGLLSDDVADWIGDDIQTVSVPASTAVGVAYFLSVPNKGVFEIIGAATFLAMTFLLASTVVDIETHRGTGSRFMGFITISPVLSTVVGGPILLLQHLYKSSEPIEPMS